MLGRTGDAQAQDMRMLMGMRIQHLTCALALLHATACGPSTIPSEEDGEDNTQTSDSEDEEPEDEEPKDEEPEDEEPEDELPEHDLGEDDLAEIAAVSHELELIVAGALAYFEDSEPQRCPHPDGAQQGGEAEFTPSEAMNCNAGPDHRCIPELEPSWEPGVYAHAMWSDSSVWEKVGWQRAPELPHAFHYNFSAVNLPEGSCTFTAEAIADFDDDLAYSSYSISGSVDANGALVGPLEIVDPFE